MGPVHHELSLLLFPPHPPPEWSPSTESQIPPAKLLQHWLISSQVHRSCQGSLPSSVLGFLFCFFYSGCCCCCCCGGGGCFFTILRTIWKLVGLDVFINRNRLSSCQVQGLFTCEESAELMCFLGFFVHCLTWNIGHGTGSRPGK